MEHWPTMISTQESILQMISDLFIATSSLLYRSGIGCLYTSTRKIANCKGQISTRSLNSNTQETPLTTVRTEGEAEHAGTHARTDITGFCGRPGQHSASPGAEQPDRHAEGPEGAGLVSLCPRPSSLLPAPSQPGPSPGQQSLPGSC